MCCIPIKLHQTLLSFANPWTRAWRARESYTEWLEGQNLPDRKDLVDPSVKLTLILRAGRKASEGFRKGYGLIYINPVLSRLVFQLATTMGTTGPIYVSLCEFLKEIQSEILTKRVSSRKDQQADPKGLHKVAFIT